MGHKTLTMTLRYAHLSTQHRLAAPVGARAVEDTRRVSFRPRERPPRTLPDGRDRADVGSAPAHELHPPLYMVRRHLDVPRAAATGAAHAYRGSLPRNPVSLIAGIAPGIELKPDVAPGGGAMSSDTASVDEVVQLLRCSEATVHRLIRITVLRAVGVGEHHVRRSDVETYRQSLLQRAPRSPR